MCSKIKTYTDISFAETATKTNLFNTIKTVPVDKSYIVDQISQEKGHKVLRLPP